MNRIIALSLGLVLTGSAWAQTDELDEVIVTAQKREQSVLDVPISITVVSGQTLDELSVDNFNDMQLYVPSFMVTPTPSNSFIFIRGIGTQGLTLSFESSVALFVDGIYGGRNRQFQDPFFDVDRVEVLRGPQGALFGRNTSAGAISVTSARPTREFSAWTQAEYETEFGSWQASGAISGPVADTVQLRFAGKFADTQGFVRNTLLNRDDGSRKDKAARLSATWQPSDTIVMLARIAYSEGDQVGMPFEFVPAGGDPMYSKRADDGLAPELDEQKSLNALLRFDFDIGAHTLTALAGHSSFEYESAINIQAIAPAHLVVQNFEDFNQQSFELRLLSPADRTVTYLVGLYADTAKSIIPSISSTDLPFTPAYPELVTRRRYVEQTDSQALFGQATWNVSDTFRVTAGVGLTELTKKGALTRSFTVVNPMFAGGALNTPLDRKRDESFVDPSFNVQWDFKPGWMAYAQYGQGSKSGGFNGPTSTDTGATWEYQDESSDTLEAGVKGSFGNGTLAVTLFNTTYEDLQKSVLNISTASFTTGNAAKAKSKGIEIEAAWRPTTALRLNASLAYLDAKFADYPGAPCPSNPANPPGCTTNLKGFRLTSAPELSGSVAANLEVPIGAALKFVGNLTAAYRDDVFYQPSYNPLEVQPSFVRFDLRTGIGSADNRWQAALLVRNLTDKNTSGLIFETFPFFINTALDRVHLPDRPRTYTLQLNYRFD